MTLPPHQLVLRVVGQPITGGGSGAVPTLIALSVLYLSNLHTSPSESLLQQWQLLRRRNCSSLKHRGFSFRCLCAHVTHPQQMNPGRCTPMGSDSPEPSYALIMSSGGETVFCHLKGSIIPQSIHHSSATRRPEWGKLLCGISAIVRMIVRARAWWVRGPRATADKRLA